MNFYKHFLGDYGRDTGHLTMLEHGAYRLMLDAFYATEMPLPEDDGRLFRLLRATTKDEREAVRFVADQFWRTTPEGLVNNRAMSEVNNAKERASTNRKIAQEREAKRAATVSKACNEPLNDSCNDSSTNARSRDSHSQKEESKFKKVRNQTTTARPAAIPVGQKLDFERFKAVYPERSGSQPWARAVKAANARSKEGSTFQSMIDGASRYSTYCADTGKTGTEFVMQAATFLGPDRHFLEAWNSPPSKADALADRNRQHAAECLDQTEEAK